MKKTIVVVVTIILALMMLVGVAACGSGSAQQPQEPVSIPQADYQTNYDYSQPTQTEETKDMGEDKYGGIVKIINTGDFDAPFGHVWVPVAAVHWSTCFSEGLVNFAQSGTFEPHTAHSWDINMEKQEVTFFLRDDVVFSDGSPLNSEVVEWNMQMWQKDNRHNEDMLIDQIRTPDDYTIIIPYGNWNNTLFQTFASHSYSMISMENAMKNGMEYANQNPVGTGPFTLKQHNRGASIVFERNQNYWQQGMPYMDGVEYHRITDAMIQNASLMTDDPMDRIDFFTTSNPEQVVTLINAGIDFDYSYARGSGSFVMCPNSMDEENNPLYDVRVRNAISYAIDREAICEAKGFGIWQPARQMTSPGFGGNFAAADKYGPNHPLLELATYDPEKSKALLAEAGYPNGFSIPLRATIVFQDQLVLIQDMLSKVGITCDLEFPEAGRITDLQINGWDGLLAYNWGQVMNSTISYFIWYHPNHLAYVSAYRPPDYEEIYLQARRSLDIDNNLMAALDEVVLAGQYYIPVYHNITTYFIRNGLTDSGFKDYTSDTMWSPWSAYWAK